MPLSPTPLLGALLLLAGVALLSPWVFQRLRRARPPKPGAGVTGRAAPAGCLPVLSGQEVLNRVGGDGLVAAIRSKVGLAQSNFDLDYLPAIHKFAEFVQLLPASESHHHAQPGGMVIHALEACDIALTMRRSVVLPLGADPERLHELEHRWTFGVFIATLLHDIGRPVADLRVTAYPGNNAGTGRIWTPLAGTMREIQSTHYRVEFAEPGERDYATHTRLGMAMLPRIVPQPTMSWLSEDGALMAELAEYLYGAAKTGALLDLARKADMESVRRNLLTGPRIRFATSRTVPLIERLMEALRRMLAEGAALPLNRSGAAGWVFDGDVWFVSKRLADEVRKYLIANESGASLPGADKNDRLFDVWQEFGALVTNPATGGAIWHARVEGDGYTHAFTLLRFPLNLLYRREEEYPTPMAGRIVVVDKDEVKSQEPKQAADAARERPTPSQLEEMDSLRAQLAARRKEPDAPSEAPSSPPAPDEYSLEPVRGAGGDDFLEDVPDPEDTGAEVFQPGTPAPQSIGRTAPGMTQPSRRQPVPSPRVLPPIVPRQKAPPPSSKATEEVPDEAKRFMAWVQEGIGNGALAYNETGALVHFVADDPAKPESGRVMLLVSPRVFRHYLETTGTETAETGDRVGSALQRAFFKPRWHRVGPKKTNIHRYMVQRRGGQGTMLSAVVIPSPERFINPVPEANPHIIPFPDEVA